MWALEKQNEKRPEGGTADEVPQANAGYTL
jgi:hypothetical protein